MHQETKDTSGQKHRLLVLVSVSALRGAMNLQDKEGKKIHQRASGGLGLDTAAAWRSFVAANDTGAILCWSPDSAKRCGEKDCRAES